MDYRPCVFLKYDMYSAPSDHPQKVMARLGAELGFVVVGSVPQSIADCWWFWVVLDGSDMPDLPPYVKHSHWMRIGSA